MPEMTDGKLALCRLDVFNEFSEAITESVSSAIKGNKKQFSLELTYYAEYCATLLANNGWGQGHEQEVYSFMWEAVPSPVLSLLLGAGNCQAEWRVGQNTDTIFLDVTVL